MTIRVLSFALVTLSLGLGCATAAPVTADRSPSRASSPAPSPVAPSPAATAEAERRLTFVAEPVRFGYDDSDLDEAGRARLQALATHLQRSPATRVRIVGHADERGTAEYNLSLGESRARVARDYLVRLGVDPARVAVSTRGEEEPAAAGSGESAWALNRRDEFILLEEVATR